MKKFTRVLLGLSFTIALLPFASAQTAPPDPNTQQLLANAAMAFSGGKPVAGIALTGKARWHYGSDQQSGSVELQANANGSGQVTLRLDRGTRVETQGAYADGPDCSWTDFNGQQHEGALHNAY